ncbi:hypothetical protein [Rothia mucilaginosa]|uniref:hypothetical protein n=1 Tax=Rothia mucilaginosa TaxID=43675 RepID=UPI0034D4CB59
MRPLENHYQGSVLAELSNRALSNFEILQLDNLVFNGGFIENNSLVERVSRGLRECLKEVFSSGFFNLFEGIIIPENLAGLGKEVTLENLIDLVYDDGIPLYGIPRLDTVYKLVRADGSRGRGNVLIECQESIFEDCMSALNSLHSDYAQEMRCFILSGLYALKNGYSDAAQGLFTNIMDTVHQKFWPDRDDRKDITHHEKGDEVPESFAEMSVGENMVFAALWNSHIAFWPKRGEEPPTEYSRHASVHGVSRRQYKLENCIQALMLVTSLLVYVDENEQVSDS